MTTRIRNSYQDLVQLEISLKKLETLFNNGDICAADVRCLNCSSKTCIWNLCLTSCAKRMHCTLDNKTSNPCCQQLTNNTCDDITVHIGVKVEHLKHIQ